MAIPQHIIPDVETQHFACKALVSGGLFAISVLGVAAPSLAEHLLLPLTLAINLIWVWG